MAAGASLAACSGGQDQPKGGRGPAEVGYAVMQPTSVAVTAELGGRVTAYQMSEVRPQVAGIVRKRFFTEGAIVRQGQTLYQIDPSLYQAAVNEAQANLLSARANAEAARIRADRYRPLAEAEAVAKQDYTDAAAQARQTAAQVAQASAQLRTAEINMRYTNVPAPITGRIGRSLATEGALVTMNQADPLAVIQRLDPIYVDIQQSSADLLALRRSLAQGDAVPASAVVRLKLEDGREYGPSGVVEFSEVMVDQNTGTVTVRARFPNPQGILLPGMFVRAVFAQAVDTRAFLVPQTAVARDPRGKATVYIVGPDNKAVQRTVVAERTIGANWVVTDGLKAGDKVIVQMPVALQPNAEIKPVPAGTPQKLEPPRQKGG
jgi:membrane fusion protein (multidrug efflux system)